MMMCLLPIGQEASVVITRKTAVTENFEITTWPTKPQGASFRKCCQLTDLS